MSKLIKAEFIKNYSIKKIIVSLLILFVGSLLLILFEKTFGNRVTYDNSFSYHESEYNSIINKYKTDNEKNPSDFNEDLVSVMEEAHENFKLTNNVIKGHNETMWQKYFIRVYMQEVAHKYALNRLDDCDKDEISNYILRYENTGSLDTYHIIKEAYIDYLDSYKNADYQNKKKEVEAKIIRYDKIMKDNRFYQYMEYNYTWLNYDTNEFTKYVSTGQYADNKTVLDPEDDIVTHLYGEGFKIPSQSDYQELFDNCSTVWEEKNGTWGLSFIGNNGYSIFLPASGFTYSYNQYLNDIGYYMTSGVAADDYIWLLYFSTSETSTYWMNVRHQGYAVRGIKCGNLSGLNDIIKNQSTVESYYNLQGIKKVFPSKGLNIIKTKDGKTKKIIVK